ncbi:MAG: hypothetical protein ABSA26_09495, partial [Thermoguttaceae bacterium]
HRTNNNSIGRRFVKGHGSIVIYRRHRHSEPALQGRSDAEAQSGTSTFTYLPQTWETPSGSARTTPQERR